MTIPVLAGIGDIAGDYDGLVVDLWGCLHNGIEAYPDAVASLVRYRERGGRVVLLSNAPRRSEAVVGQLRRMGVPDEGVHDAILTAGEATRLAIAERADPWYAALGPRFHHIGTEPDSHLLDGLGFSRVETVAEADFILCCGIRAAGDTLADFEEELAAGIARGLPMVCANPDLFVLRGPRREMCAGRIAERYREMGGQARGEGKPHPDVYRRCAAILGGLAPSRMAGIGDGLETDIRGAAAAGLDAIWVTGGLPAHDWDIAPETPPDPDRVCAACREAGVQPRAAIPLLAW